MSRILALLLVCTLAACGAEVSTSPVRAPSKGALGLAKTPTLAYVTGRGEETTVHWVRGTKEQKIRGQFVAMTPNGSLIVNQDSRRTSGPTFYEAVSGKSTNIAQWFSPGDVIGFGEGAILTIRPGEESATLRGFDGMFKPTRLFPLPGKTQADGTGSRYSAPVMVGSLVFAVRTDGVGGDGSPSDELVRLTHDGKVTTSLQDRNVRALGAATTGNQLVAVLAGGPATAAAKPADKSVVTISPKTGRVMRSYGLPPACKKLKSNADDHSCVDHVELDGQRVVARLRSSTWSTTAGHGWVEDPSQRGRIVAWQSRAGRLEGPGKLSAARGLSLRPPVRWVAGDDRRTILGTDRAGQWWAPGSLFRP
jgi:hypothetical protein